VRQRHGKQGVKEVVQEIVKRKTKKEAGHLLWIEGPTPEL
jgi:3-hydroxyisobutyryl-CoA hydrolase